MVSQLADSAAPFKASDCIRIEASDPRSDNGRRMVEISRDAVTIRRAVAGVSMAIRVEPSAYRGVALRIAGLDDGRFHYAVQLAHRDPDLSVPLGEGDEMATMEAQWREWIALLRLPALVGRAESADIPVNVRGALLVRAASFARRRGSSLARRRPRFLKRRALGCVQEAGLANAEASLLLRSCKVTGTRTPL